MSGRPLWQTPPALAPVVFAVLFLVLGAHLEQCTQIRAVVA